MTPDPVTRWAILGTGKIASIFATSLSYTPGSSLVAVGSRDASRAARFVQEHRLPAASTGNYEEILARDDVDVVYVATPHTSHAELVVAAAREGKHVLCEKPLAVNTAEAETAVAAAEQHGIFLMEGFAYRCHPQTSRLLSLLAEETVGEVRLIQAVFGYDAGPSPTNYLLRADLAGGSILDVGCYTMSMCGLLARAGGLEGSIASVSGVAHISDVHGVDTRAVGALQLSHGATAEIACAIDANLGGSLTVIGSHGRIVLSEPWLPGRQRPATLSVERFDGSRPEVETIEADDLYRLEAEEVSSCIIRRERESPRMTLSDSLANMAALDRWRSAVGLHYPFEQAAMELGDR